MYIQIHHKENLHSYIYMIDLKSVNKLYMNDLGQQFYFARSGYYRAAGTDESR